MKLIRIASRIALPSDSATLTNLATIIHAGMNKLSVLENEFLNNVIKASSAERIDNYKTWWNNMYKFIGSTIHAPMDNRVVAANQQLKEAVAELADELDLLEYIPIKRVGHSTGFSHHNDPNKNPDKAKELSLVLEIDNPSSWGNKIKDRFAHIKNLMNQTVNLIHDLALKGTPSKTTLN